MITIDEIFLMFQIFIDMEKRNPEGILINHKTYNYLTYAERIKLTTLVDKPKYFCGIKIYKTEDLPEDEITIF